MQTTTTLRAVRAPRRLLIVQRNGFVARSLARYFDAHFDLVELADDGRSAEAVLSDPRRTPTHLVCGQDLGPEFPSGTEMIPHWRQRCPDIVCAVIATGQHALPENLEGVDAVFLKPCSPASLLPFLSAP
jgi:hypothetical protein